MFKLTVREENNVINMLNFETHKEATDWIFENMSDSYENHDYPDSNLTFEDAEDEYWGATDENHWWYKSYRHDNQNESVIIYYEITKLIAIL